MRALRVLLAEDDPDHRALLVRTLEESGAIKCVGMARSGRELCARARSAEFDCVITDFHLADGEADEIVEVLRPLFGERPVLVVSGSDEQRTAIAALRTGCVDFIPKAAALSGSTLCDRVEQAVVAWRQKQAAALRAKRRERDLSERIELDALTKLHNRYFLQHLRSDVSESGDRRRPSCCILLDVDHFKQVNDTFGHDIGDSVLTAIADCIRAHLLPGDRALRVGGEEFLVLRRCGDLLENWLWAENLRQGVAALSIPAAAGTVRPTVSAGIAVREAAAHSPDATHGADQALYLAKHQGRNRTCTWQMVDVFKRAADLKQSRPAATALELRHGLLKELLKDAGPALRDHLEPHCQFVGRAAHSLGLCLTPVPAVAEQIRIAGIFHDIGKIFIPETLLAKADLLTAEEFVLISKHAALGAELISALTGDAGLASIVRHHHVRYDATSPDAPLPIAVEILSVADAWAAMISGRQYQRAMSIEAAAAELRRHRGGQFAPEVVDAWLSMRVADRLAA